MCRLYAYTGNIIYEPAKLRRCLSGKEDHARARRTTHARAKRTNNVNDEKFRKRRCPARANARNPPEWRVGGYYIRRMVLFFFFLAREKIGARTIVGGDIHGERAFLDLANLPTTDRHHTRARTIYQTVLRAPLHKLCRRQTGTVRTRVPKLHKQNAGGNNT